MQAHGKPVGHFGFAPYTTRVEWPGAAHWMYDFGLPLFPGLAPPEFEVEDAPPLFDVLADVGVGAVALEVADLAGTLMMRVGGAAGAKTFPIRSTANHSYRGNLLQ